jgi:hypothetical protein
MAKMTPKKASRYHDAKRVRKCPWIYAKNNAKFLAKIDAQKANREAREQRAAEAAS